MKSSRWFLGSQSNWASVNQEVWSTNKTWGICC